MTYIKSEHLYVANFLEEFMISNYNIIPGLSLNNIIFLIA